MAKGKILRPRSLADRQNDFAMLRLWPTETTNFAASHNEKERSARAHGGRALARLLVGARGARWAALVTRPFFLCRQWAGLQEVVAAFFGFLTDNNKPTKESTAMKNTNHVGTRKVNFNRRAQCARPGPLWGLRTALLFLLALITQGQAQTIVCGNISGTWTPAGNPWIVSCDSTVPSGQTLTIQPGVIVWIGEGVSITGNGLIQAEGSASQRIIFQPPIASQFWNTISVNASGPTNRFNYCDFQNANTALAFGNTGINEVSFCSFRNVTNGITMGVYGDNSTQRTKIMNCVFSNCVAQGVVGVARGNAWYGFDGWSYKGYSWFAKIEPSIKNCVFQNTRHACYFLIYGVDASHGYIGYGYANPEITGNIFRDLSGTAFLMSVSSHAGSGAPIFINNTIINCGVGVDSQVPWDSRIENNIFVGTTNAVKTSGGLSRAVRYNCFYRNATDFDGYPLTYGSFIIPNRNGTPSDLFFNIGQNPLFVATTDFHLQTNSPCIDAGTPDLAYADTCFPPSQGTSFPDLGVYGGPDACNLVVGTPPRITAQPGSQSSCLDHGASFSVTASGTPPLSYQWFHGATLLPGQTGTSLSVTNLQSTDAGTYQVIVTNVYGAATSAPAALVVNDACVDLCMYAGLNIAGLPGRTYELRYTTDLSNTNFTTWNLLATNTTPWFYVDTNSCGYPRRFYGVKLLP